jgi:hypothetical protein
MRRQWFTTGMCLALLAAAPAFVPAAVADDRPAASVDDARAKDGFTATVLERRSGSLTLQKENGEVEILSFDDPGLTVKIDKDVAKGSHVRVTEERTSMSRTLTVKLAPAS